MKFSKKLTTITKKIGGSSLLILSSFLSFNSYATSPPEFVVNDNMGVNIASGIPSFVTNDLKIGTQGLSLSHSVSSYAGFFYGYHDIFKAAIDPDQFKRPGDNVYTDAVKVQLNGSSTRFLVNDDGTYTDFRSTGETLVRLNDGTYLYTSKNGTTLTTLGAFGHTITYPNGFQVTINRAADYRYRIQSVVTNTGLQRTNGVRVS
jgi:hypothetical protein